MAYMQAKERRWRKLKIALLAALTAHIVSVFYYW